VAVSADDVSVADRPSDAPVQSAEWGADDILFVQTADPFVYKTMLDLTAGANIAYCQRHAFHYESYTGIKRGVVPWQASYNRLYILCELVERGYRGWVAYLDADAFVVDLSFDLPGYLASNGECCFFAATGGSTTPWDVNSGVFFLDLGDPDGRAMATDWLARFVAAVPDSYLFNPESKWDEYPNDQGLLYDCLRANKGALLKRTKKETRGLYNYRSGTFIRQAIRAGFGSLASRLDWIETETKQVLAAAAALPPLGRPAAGPAKSGETARPAGTVAAPVYLSPSREPAMPGRPPVPAKPAPARAASGGQPQAATPATAVTAAPSRFGGIVEPLFEPLSELGRLGQRTVNARLQVFGPALPAPQHAILRESELPPQFVAEHYQYAAPPSVAVYAVAGAVLWANGLLTSGTQFVAPTECLPGYFRPTLQEKSAPLHPAQAGALGRDDVVTVTLDHAVVSALHPNMLYGHFLLDMLPRLYLAAVLRELGAEIPLALSTKLPEWAKAWVRLLHADDRIVWYDGSRQRVVAPSVVLPAMMHVERGFHPAANFMIRDLVQRSRIPHSAPAHRHTFVRPQSGDEQIENADEVAQAMSDAGFTVIRPGELSPDQVIRAFSDAEVIVGEYGFMLQNALFAPPGARVVAINFANNYQSKIARLRGHRMAYVAPKDGQFRHWRFGQGLSRKFAVDVGSLRRTVAEIAAAPG
jgi:hypothetical protein